jgi:hypothetical protein
MVRKSFLVEAMILRQIGENGAAEGGGAEPGLGGL